VKTINNLIETYSETQEKTMSVEQKIQELLEESKKAANLHESTDQIVDELDEEVNQLDEEGTEQPDVAKANAGGVNGKQIVSQKSNLKTAATSAKGDAAAGEGSHLKGTMKEEITVDVSEDVAALTSDETLSEEFKLKAATIFEAAVISRIKTEVAKIEESYEARLEEETQLAVEGLVEKVDGYLDYVVEQWMKQNELALESGIKSEILENFVSGLKGLFEEHYIDVPEEKYDVLGEMDVKIAELEGKLNETVDANIALNKQVGELKRHEVVAELAAGLTDTESEKFQGLAKEIAFESVEQYKGKLQTIRESYFTKTAKTGDVKTVVTEETGTNQQTLSESIAKYSSFIGKSAK
jgi:hypothetical protein